MSKKMRLKELSAYSYWEPGDFLSRVFSGFRDIALWNYPDNIRNMRTPGLKRERESLDAAIFCWGMSKHIGTAVHFSPVESQDFDFVTRWISDGIDHFAPVQLKELVSKERNVAANLSDLIASLSKYSAASELVVAIKLSREIRFDPSEWEPPDGLSFAGIWMFGLISLDGSEWALWGDFMKPPVTVGLRFSLPSADELPP
jgi:hypothetical protein